MKSRVATKSSELVQTLARASRVQWCGAAEIESSFLDRSSAKSSDQIELRIFA